MFHQERVPCISDGLKRGGNGVLSNGIFEIVVVNREKGIQTFWEVYPNGLLQCFNILVGDGGGDELPCLPFIFRI